MLNFKSRFLLKTQILKYQGKKLMQLEKLKNWLEETLEEDLIDKIDEEVVKRTENF